MDMMEIRRRVMMNMATSGAKVKTGTFVGSNNIDQTITVGFEPDIIIINCSSLDFETAGWMGVKNIIIIKNMIVYQSRHNNTGASSANVFLSDNLGGDYPSYGKTSGNSAQYGIYQDGNMTISNSTRNAINYFINGETYDWIAIKL